MSKVRNGGARGPALVAIGNLAAPLAGIIVSPIIARQLGVEGRGDVAAATAPVLLATAVMTLGIPEAVTYYVARSQRLLRSILRFGAIVLVISGIVSSAAIILFAPILSDGRGSLTAAIIIAAAAVIPSMAVGALRGAAAGRAYWGLVASEKYVLAILRTGAVVVLAIAGHLSVISASIAIAYSPAASGVVYVLLYRGRRLDTQQQPLVKSEFFRFSMSLWLGSIAAILLARLDQVLMTPLSNSEQLGFYAVAVNIAEAPLMISLAVRDVLLSSDARDPSESRIYQASRVSLIVVGLSAVALVLSFPLIFNVIFGSEFWASSWSVIVLLLSVVLGVPGSIVGAVLISRGSPKLRNYAIGVAAVINTITVVLLVPPLGALGAAIATLVGSLVATAASITFGVRCVGLKFVPLVAVSPSDFTLLWQSLMVIRNRGRINREADR